MSGLVVECIHGMTYVTLLLDVAVQLLVPWVVRGVSPMQRCLRGWGQLLEHLSWHRLISLPVLLDLRGDVGKALTVYLTSSASYSEQSPIFLRSPIF